VASNLITTKINNKFIKQKLKIMIYTNRTFNEFFDKFFNEAPTYQYYKKTETKNTDEKYEIDYTKDGAYLFFEAPGFNKSNLKVEMENGVLHIEGERTYKMDGESKTKSISKQFNIGEGYNPESVEATIEDGLLTVFVPSFKKQEKKRISIL
jgi:HSP20 family protein